MLVHIFGAVSSPSCPTYALLKTADDNRHLYTEEIINTISHHFYVDDCLKFIQSGHVSLPADHLCVHQRWIQTQ